MALIEQHRRGMSLTELLVVISILGLLAVTVIPAINANSDARKTRLASSAIKSFLDQSQSRSIGRASWSGFMILPISATSDAADSLVFVDCPPPYRGDLVSSAIGVTGFGSGTASAGAFSGLANYLQGASTNALTIRFGGTGPVYRLTSGSSQPFTFQLQSGVGGQDLGQGSATTPWPAVAKTYPVEIFRDPVPTGVPLLIPEDRVIDLGWSGFNAAAPSSSLSAARQFRTGSSITVSFDSAGELRQFSYTAPNGTPVSETAHGPMFLLIGRADRVGQDRAALSQNDDTLGANWQYADSTWVAVDPKTGIATTAPCDPDPRASASLIESQDAIREKMKLKAIERTDNT